MRVNILNKISLKKLVTVSTGVAIAITAISIVILSGGSTKVHAANMSDFDPGYIISDSIFYNASTMSTTTIQNFLNSEVGTCDTNGTQPASDKNRSDLTHAQYAALKGWSAPPYTCIKDYSTTTSQESADAYCNGYTQSTQTAAQIIYGVAQSCGINPQVLIVLLQKEQGLITDSWPLASQYSTATGYACPDSEGCSTDPNYGGLFNQLYLAARQFKKYQANPSSYSYVASRNNTILWNPNTSCGSSTVYIQNQATAGLYNYTPYRPNQAALNAGYGSGDSCSSYGNRNFWEYFTDWFGNTQQSFVSIDSPRWMQLKTNTNKIHYPTGVMVGPELSAGAQALFVDKVLIGSVWYARTTWDKTNNNTDVISSDDLEEIPITAITPKWVSIPSGTTKVDAIREKNYESIDKWTATQVVDTMTVNGVAYYRTAFEHDQNTTRVIPVSATEDFKFYDFITPRVMITNKATQKINVQTGEVSASIPKDTAIFMNRRITIGGIIYAQAKSDNGTLYAISAHDLDG